MPLPTRPSGLLYLALIIPIIAYLMSRTTQNPSNTSHPILLPEEPMMESPFPPCPPIPVATGPVDLIRPPTDDREHKYLTLPNGLEVIVVSDPKADKAAASMDVGVGHLSDPENLPGCAHFWCALLFRRHRT
jgi:insulysin